MDSHFISTEEAGRRLGVTRERVGVLIRTGRLRAKKIGEGNRATWLIDPPDLEAVRDRPPGRPRKRPAVVKKGRKPGKAKR